MLFNSFDFLLVFLPLALLGAVIAQNFKSWAVKAWLVVASLGFYAWWSADFLVILLGAILVNYILLRGALAFPVRSDGRKAVVVVGAMVNLSLLGWYKYAGFLAFNLNALVGTEINLGAILLPLGISFFTFQKLALLVDVYRGDVEDVELIDYMLFVTFFPQLIAGPIVLFPEVRDQFRESGRIGVRFDNVVIGLTLFAMGLAKKVFIADKMAAMANPVFTAAAKGTVLHSADAWVAALAYTFQIYFDFSGYSDMAIGLAWMFGIALPFNFNSPYKSTSIIEFWHRWHMTLSYFLRTYLYIPLGGNQRGPWRRHINLLTVMLLGGLWHGAAWTFVLWGGLHGTALILNHLWRNMRKGRENGRWLTALSWVATFLLVTVTWVLFRADNFTAASCMISAMTDPHRLVDILNEGFSSRPLVPQSNTAIQWLVAVLIFVLVMPNTMDLLRGRLPEVGPEIRANHPLLALTWRPNLAWAGLTAICLTLGILGLSRPQVFIYFQF